MLSKECPLISIIVPVYKVEKEIQRCLDSLVEQDYDNKEIILIDDGSPDKSGQICDEYSSTYHCVRVIHQENMGLAAVRNLGLKEARGDFISFIDSDDYVLEGLYTHCVNLINKHGCDIVCFGQQNIYGDTSKVQRIDVNKEHILILSSEEAIDQIFFEKNVDVITCNKIVKRDLFTNVCYPTGKLYEDMFTTYKFLSKARKVLCTDLRYYIYCHRPDSIGGSSDKDKTVDLLKAVDETYEFAKSFCVHNRYIDLGRLYWYVIVFNMILKTGETNEDLLQKIRILSKNRIKQMMLCPLLGINKRIELILIGINYSMYKKIYMVYIRKFRNYNL